MEWEKVRKAINFNIPGFETEKQESVVKQQETKRDTQVLNEMEAFEKSKIASEKVKIAELEKKKSRERENEIRERERQARLEAQQLKMDQFERDKREREMLKRQAREKAQSDLERAAFEKQQRLKEQRERDLEEKRAMERDRQSQLEKERQERLFKQKQALEKFEEEQRFKRMTPQQQAAYLEKKNKNVINQPISTASAIISQPNTDISPIPNVQDGLDEQERLKIEKIQAEANRITAEEIKRNFELNEKQSADRERLRIIQEKETKEAQRVAMVKLRIESLKQEQEMQQRLDSRIQDELYKQAHRQMSYSSNTSTRTVPNRKKSINAKRELPSRSTSFPRESVEIQPHELNQIRDFAKDIEWAEKTSKTRSQIIDENIQKQAELETDLIFKEALFRMGDASPPINNRSMQSIEIPRQRSRSDIEFDRFEQSLKQRGYYKPKNKKKSKKCTIL